MDVIDFDVLDQVGDEHELLILITVLLMYFSQNLWNDCLNCFMRCLITVM